MKAFVTFFIFTFIFLFFPINIYAVTTIIKNYPSEISSEPFTIDVIIDGAGAGTNYLRIDLYKPTTTNYFGETFNGNEWYRGTDYIKYLPITIQSGTNWTGQVQGRIGEISINQYDGPGIYKLRVRRYTSSGSNNTIEANNSSVDINVQLPIISPTISPTPTLSPDPTENISPTLNIQPQTINNVLISEVMASPENNQNEWIELYNNNDVTVRLDNWYLDDIENGGSSPKKFSLSIDSKQYAVYDFSTSIFNNSGDSVRLLDSNMFEKDSFQYEKTENGKSLGRISFTEDNFCLQNPSKGINNNSCLYPSSSPSPVLSNTPLLQPSATIVPSETTAPSNFLITINTQKPVDSIPSVIDKSNVLGTSSGEKLLTNNRNKAFLLSFSFSSVSFTFLALMSILYKIKIS